MTVTVLVRGPFIRGTSVDHRLTIDPAINRIVTVKKDLFEDKVAFMQSISKNPLLEHIPESELRQLLEDCFEYEVVIPN